MRLLPDENLSPAVSAFSPRRRCGTCQPEWGTVARYLLSILLWWVGSVDPRDVGDLRRFGRLAEEPFGVCRVGGAEYTGTLVADCFG